MWITVVTLHRPIQATLTGTFKEYTCSFLYKEIAKCDVHIGNSVGGMLFSPLQGVPYDWPLFRATM